MADQQLNRRFRPEQAFRPGAKRGGQLIEVRSVVGLPSTDSIMILFSTACGNGSAIGGC